jgi:hypothetical protein
VDEVDGRGEHEVVWRLHLTPGEATLRSVEPGRTRVTFVGTPAIDLVVRHPDTMILRLGESEMSDSYGSVESRPLIEAASVVRLPVRITCTIRPHCASESG